MLNYESGLVHTKMLKHCLQTNVVFRNKLKAVTIEESGLAHDEDHEDAVTSQHVEAVKLKKTLKSPVPPRLTGAPSAKVVTASNRLDCTYSEESGRHFVAAVNIQPGLTGS